MRKKQTRLLCSVVGVILAGGLAMTAWWQETNHGGDNKTGNMPSAAVLVARELKSVEQQEAREAQVRAEKKKEKQKKRLAKQRAKEQKKKQKLEVNEIYSFLQGPIAWKSKAEWSGQWYKLEFGNRRFGSFGCGFCCMANIYSTLSPYECSPVDIFHRATEVTEYYPCAESGAISWDALHTTLESCGIENQLRNKPDQYERFQKQMQKNPCMIVLISSANDTKFWQNIGGHYVDIWDYQAKTDDVFLTEPGDPQKNRVRVPLQYVYDALKTSSDHQYMIVQKYQEEKNTWKHNGIDIKWRRPKDSKK